jgi:hypothetical protein
VTRTTLQRVAGGALLLLLIGYDAVATGWLGFNERVVAMCRNVVFPGLGFIETDIWLTVLFAVVAAASVVAWLRWGTDWIVGTVWVLAVLVAFLTVPTHHHDAAATLTVSPPPVRIARASHEFAAVLVIAAVLSRLRLAIAGMPGVRRVVARRATAPADRATALRRAAPTNRCRAATIAAIAQRAGASRIDEALFTEVLEAPDVRRRAARVAAWARWRLGGDPLRHDNAHARAALALWGGLTPEQLAGFRTDGQRSALGVPASEPTWARLLDGTLAAIALDELGERAAVGRWRAALDGPFRLRHGRRHGAVHTPTMFPVATGQPWEHAAATALARTRGWLGDDDWPALRQRSLGAAARGGRRAEDARLVAAARVWAHVVDDGVAASILARPTRSTDPVAASLDDLFDAIRRSGGHAGEPLVEEGA